MQSVSFNTLSSHRLDVWLLLIEQLQNNWLIGGGPQSYFFYPNRGSIIIHAHNFILQFLGEWGVIGTLLFLTLLLYAFRKAIRIQALKVNNTYHFLAFMAIISLSITGLFGGTFFFPQISVILIFSFAIITSSEPN
jgi:O-antigen ligase